MRVLIGYDGSAGARAAIRDLAFAGLPVGAEALVLCVANAVVPPAKPRETTSAARIARAADSSALDEAAAVAEEGRGRVLAVAPSWNVRCESRVDSPAWALLQRAASWSADLLVVAPRSADVVTLGSVTGKLIHHAPCAVRVARRPAIERRGGERIVVGVDGSPGSEAAVATVLRRDWPSGSAARVVTAMDPGAFSAHAWFGADHENPLAWLRALNDAAAEKLAAAGLDAAPVLVEGDPARVLVEEASSWDADCVFVGAHSWHGAERALVGSVAAAVAARAGCSVEIARPAV